MEYNPFIHTQTFIYQHNYHSYTLHRPRFSHNISELTDLNEYRYYQDGDRLHVALAMFDYVMHNL